MDALLYTLRLYVAGLRYTLVLNVLGIGLLARAWHSDLWLFDGATYVPRWLMFATGMLLQIPGLLSLRVGVWSVCSTPGTRC